MRYHRAGQGSDSDLHQDQAGSRLPLLGELLIDLSEDRLVALSDPCWDELVARPTMILNEDVIDARRVRGLGDSVVLGSRHYGHSGTIGRDGVDSGLRRSLRHPDLRSESQPPRHPRHTTAVIAVGRGQQTEPTQRRDSFLQLLDRNPGLGGGPQSLGQGEIGGPSRPKDLVGRKPQPPAFILYLYRSDPQPSGQPGKRPKRRRRVSGQAPMEGPRRICRWVRLEVLPVVRVTKQAWHRQIPPGMANRPIFSLFRQ